MRRWGLALPGNGTVVATHGLRKELFAQAAQRIVAMCEAGTATLTPVLPRSICTKAAFHNAMSLDITMGGSTNTVFHMLAIAHEGGVDFHHRRHRLPLPQDPQLLQGLAKLRLPCPTSHRAGGILGIMGQLDRGGSETPRSTAPTE